MSQKKLTPSEILFILNYLESNFPVERWTYKNIDLWPIVRINLGNFFNSNISRSKPLSKIKKLTNEFLKFWQFIQNFNKNLISNKHAEVFFLTGTANRALLNDKTIAKEVDPIFSQLSSYGIRSYIFEIQNRPTLPLNRDNPSHLSNIIFLLTSLRAKILFIFSFDKRKDLKTERIQEMKEYLKNIHGVSPPILEENNLIKKILSIYCVSLYFESLLKKIKPRICAATVYYNYESLGLCLAAKRLKIPFMDMQHGIAGKFHRNYDNWILSRNYNLLPDIFWCWNTADAETIRFWGDKINPKIETIVGGNPFMHASLKFQGNIYELDKSDTEHKIKILVSLQHDYIPNLLLEVMLNSPKSFHFFIKEHPLKRIRNSREVKLKLDQKQVQYDFTVSNSNPLFSLLNYMNAHLTEHSAVALDCLAFNIPTIFINEEGKDYFRNLILQDKCFYSSNVNEIIRLIQSNAISSKKTYSDEIFIEAVEKLAKKVK